MNECKYVKGSGTVEESGELKCGSPGEQGVLTGDPFEPFSPRGPCGIETERARVHLGPPQ